MKEGNFLDSIKSVFEGPVNEYKVRTGTYGNVVFEINQDWIFRFSRENRDVKQLQIEKIFLPEFEKASPLPVPHIEYKGTDFIGYKKLEGIPFTSEVCESLSEKQRNAVWESIGNFLSQLHAMNFKHENLVEYPLGDDDFWNHLWKPVASQLSKETQEKAFTYFTKHFEEANANPIQETICHGDFHPNHILFNEKSKSITGIIDFGRICINDPAVDFNLIERFLGGNAVKSVLQHYKRDIPENFRARINFQNKRRLFAAFFHATVVGEVASFPRYLKRIEDTFTV